MCFAYCSLDNMNRVIRVYDKPKGNKYIKLVFTNKPLLGKQYILHEIYSNNDMIKRVKVYTNHEYMNITRLDHIIKMILIQL